MDNNGYWLQAPVWTLKGFSSQDIASKCLKFFSFSYSSNIVDSMRPHDPEDLILLITPLHAADSTLPQLPDSAACALFVQIIAIRRQSAFAAFEK